MLTSDQLLSAVEDIVEKLAKNEIDEEELTKKADKFDPDEAKKAFALGAELYCYRNGLTDPDDIAEIIKTAGEVYINVVTADDEQEG